MKDRTYSMRVWLVLCVLLPVVSWAQWVQLDGPYGGKINTMVGSGANVFAGTEYGLYRLSATGTRWEHADAGLTNKVITALFLDGSVLYVGLYGGGLVRTTDNGQTWKDMNLSRYDPWIASVVANGALVIAGTEHSGAWMSTDGGGTWVNKTGNQGKCLAVALRESVAIADKYYSTNPVATWQRGTGFTWADVYSIAIGDGVAFAGVPDGVYRSMDNGAKWAASTSGLPIAPIRALLVNGPLLFAGGSDIGVYRSADNGVNWGGVNTGIPTMTVLSLASADKGTFAGTEGAGVFLSADSGTHWSPLNEGISSQIVMSLAVVGTRLFAGAHHGGVSVSDDDGETWKTLNNGLTDLRVTSIIAVREANGDTALWAGTLGGPFRSINHGATWTASMKGLPRTDVLSMASSGTTVFAGTALGLYAWSPLNSTWTPVSGDISSEQVHALARINTAIFAGTDNGVYAVLSDGGGWASQKTNLAPYDVYSFCVIGSELFAGTFEGGIYRTTDYGGTWVEASGNFPRHNRVSAIAAHGKTLFAAGAIQGIYTSIDDGGSWTLVNAGTVNLPRMRSLVFKDSTMYAGTPGAGIWRLPLADVPTTVDHESNRPTTVILEQNYPNPFNPSTTIRYGLPARSDVTLTVFNTLGQQVRMLHYGEQDAGNHEAVFNAQGLPSGVYFYRLQVRPSDSVLGRDSRGGAGAHTETKRLLLLK